MTTTTETRIRGGIGESVKRPDGIPKVTGNFAYASFNDENSDGFVAGVAVDPNTGQPGNPVPGDELATDGQFPVGLAGNVEIK